MIASVSVCIVRIVDSRQYRVHGDTTEVDVRLWTPLVAPVVSLHDGGGGALNTNGRGTTHANHRRCTIKDACLFNRLPVTRRRRSRYFKLAWSTTRNEMGNV